VRLDHIDDILNFFHGFPWFSILNFEEHYLRRFEREERFNGSKLSKRSNFEYLSLNQQTLNDYRLDIINELLKLKYKRYWIYKGNRLV
jgi:hypothetical protein